MTRSVRIAALHRLSGRIAMVFFLCCLATLVDGLAAKMQQGPNRFDVLPGTQHTLSGPMPPNTDRIEDFVIEGSTDGGHVQLVPEGIYTGYWFGSGMWRGAVRVDEAADKGDYELRVRDKAGEKQNPTLIYQVVVWENAAALRAGSFSRLVRWFDLEPFSTAMLLGPICLLGGLINFLLGWYWSRTLRAEGCAEIYRLIKVDDGFEATCDESPTSPENPDASGRTCLVRRADGTRLGEAVIVRHDKKDAVLHVPATVRVRLGDVVCLQH